MSAYFFDSSGLIKRFAREKGTAWVLSLLKPSSGSVVFIARITSVEVAAGLAKQNRLGNISATQLDKAIRRFRRSLQNRFAFVEIRESLANEAMELAIKHGLRGYDAVQLAAVLQVHRKRNTFNLSPITFVSADDNLNAAAAAEGLRVENPNN